MAKIKIKRARTSSHGYISGQKSAENVFYGVLYQHAKDQLARLFIVQNEVRELGEEEENCRVKFFLEYSNTTRFVEAFYFSEIDVSALSCSVNLRFMYRCQIRSSADKNRFLCQIRSRYLRYLSAQCSISVRSRIYYCCADGGLVIIHTSRPEIVATYNTHVFFTFIGKSPS